MGGHRVARLAGGGVVSEVAAGDLIAARSVDVHDVAGRRQVVRHPDFNVPHSGPAVPGDVDHEAGLCRRHLAAVGEAVILLTPPPHPY